MLENQGYGISFSAYEQYMRQVKQTPQLTNEEETNLLLAIQSGVEVCQARDRLVEGYQPLLIGLAKRFVRRCKEMELLDLVQEGNLGLLQAIEKYDVSKGESSFKTFAFAWVRGTMLTAFWRYEGAIRLPLNKVQAIRQMGVVNTRLLSLLGREPTIIETAQEMQVNERDVRELIVLQEQQVVSLYAFPTEDDDLSLEDVVADPTASLFMDDSSIPTPLETALASLPDRERIVVNLRYGFDDGQARTQREVAHLLGVTLSTVEAVDRRAQRRLRQALCA